MSFMGKGVFILQLCSAFCVLYATVLTLFIWNSLNLHSNLFLLVTGLPTTQMLSLVMGTLYRKFIEKDIKNLEDFQKAILDIFE